MTAENEPYVSPASENNAEPTTDETAVSETTEEVEGSEPSAQVEDTEEEPEQTDQTPKKENAVQKRIDQITKEKHEARAEAEYWRKVATGEITPPQQQPAPAPHPEGKPQVEQFESYEDFVEALTDWKAEQREAKRAQETRAKTIAEQTITRMEAARATHEDFDNVVSNLNGIMVPPVTIESIQESEQSAEIFYYLGKNVAEAKKLQGMSISAQLREIGRIEEKLSAKPAEKEVKRISSAPVPLNPVNSSANVTPKDNDSIADDEEWYRRENARLAKLGRAY